MFAFIPAQQNHHKLFDGVLQVNCFAIFLSGSIQLEEVAISLILIQKERVVVGLQARPDVTLLRDEHARQFVYFEFNSHSLLINPSPHLSYSSLIVVVDSIAFRLEQNLPKESRVTLGSDLSDLISKLVPLIHCTLYFSNNNNNSFTRAQLKTVDNSNLQDMCHPGLGIGD
jgi:hypothetical protein